jgi:tetratricopeptide (TPR) repeat protein
MESKNSDQQYNISSLVKRELANNYFKDNKFTEASVLYSELLENDPLNYYLISNRAACYIKLSDFNKACEDAKKCTELKPTWSKAHFRLGTACHGLQMYDEALVAYNKAYELEPLENYKNMIDIVKNKLVEMKSMLINESLTDDFNIVDKLSMSPIFSNMFDKVIDNPKLMEKIMDINFQSKILGLQNNPIQAMQDPEVINMMQEMINEMKELKM